MLQNVGRYKYMPTKRNISQKKILSKTEQVLALAQAHGLLRSRDLAKHNIPRQYLLRLCEQGQLEQVGRGLYRLPNATVSEHHTLAQVGKRFPKGVVCLLTALRFHHLTTQSPSEIWIAIDYKARLPVTNDLPLRIVRFSGIALRKGHDEHLIEGVPVHITTPAKTVADCFKYRNKIGLDVALEALREGWRERRYTMDELWKSARLARVTNVMRPYLESLTWKNSDLTGVQANRGKRENNER